MKLLSVLLVLLLSHNSFAQKKPKAVVGIETDMEPVYNEAYIYDTLNDENHFNGEPLLETKSVGFKSFHIGSIEIPVHIEPEDDFDLVLYKDLSLKDNYYRGEQGAVKNNYVLSRHFFLKELELRPDFLKANETTIVNRILVVKDSMLAIASGLALSEQFMTDERVFWDAYLDYHTTFYEVLRQPVYSPLMPLSVPLTYYPKEDFLNEYYTGIPFYNILGYQYYITKIDESPTRKEKLAVLKEIRKSSYFYPVLDWMENQIYNRSKQSGIYLSLFYSFTDNYEVLDTLAYVRGSHKKSHVGKSFPSVYFRDVFDNVKLFKSFGERKSAILLYASTDPRLQTNLLLWNQFYTTSQGQYDNYITICIDADLGTGHFTDVLKENGTAGTHLAVNYSIGEPLLQELGQFVLPAVLTVQATNTISDFNTLKNMANYGLIFYNPMAHRFLPALGAY